MVGLVVVSHSARLADGVLELAREMAGDVRLEAAGGLALAPADAAAAASLGTDAARVMEAIEAADDGSGDGVLVLMDLGSAILSAETALDLIDPALAERVRLVPAPLVEGAVAAAVAAQSGGALDAVAAEAAGGLAAKTAHLGAPAADDRRVLVAEHTKPCGHAADTVEARFTVTVAQGLHARPAARFVRTAAAHDATIEVINATTGAGPAPAGSLNAIATLGVREGHDVIVRASGPEAREAIEELRAVAGAPAAPEPSATAATADAAISPPPPGQPLRGLPASPGIAIAPIRQLGATAPPPIDDTPAGTPAEERAALRRACDAVRDQIGARRDRLAAEAGPAEAEILDALGLVLDDEAILGPARTAIEHGMSAARAWADAVAAMTARYEALEDPYQRERAADLEDVARRVLVALAAAPPTNEPTAPAPKAILATRELTPIDAAGLDPAAVAGIATARGGPTSHGAILARALGVPAVVGLGDHVTRLPDGTPAILDGGAGHLIPDPPRDERRRYAERRAAALAAAEEARARAHEPATTRDGVAVEVAANAGGPRDAGAAVAAGADGVGLLRTEFAFLGRDSEPTEDEQAALYAEAAAALGGRPLVVRTLDAGADKPLPYLAMAREDNPFLGVRGVRLGLQRPALLRAQLRAIVRAAAEHEHVKLMFPMVATREELRAARALLDDARRETGAEPRAGFEAGIMVEVPSAALTAPALAPEVDFFSIGTNDLTQYALAAERGNAAVAGLADGLHPAVLTLIGAVCEAARAHGRWVGVCGELAADPVAVPLLIGLGVRELSVAAPSVGAVKAAVRALDTGAAAELARAARAAASAAEVRALVVSEA